MILTVIVIDDSPLQKLATCNLIKNNPNLKLIGAYSDPLEGLAAVNALQPDVLMCDVEMPGMTGFQLIQGLTCNCQVIMNSTRSVFAQEAFQYDAVEDFMLKPMNKPRFEKSIERVLANENLRLQSERLFRVPTYTERLSQAS